MGTTPQEEALQYKEKGNEAFKNGDWNTAIHHYTKAINISSETDSRDVAVYYKNRAATYLKLAKFEEALSDCNKSLEIGSTDPKALFRRSAALESLERYEEAYRDARTVLSVDPSNKVIQPVLERLHGIVQERARQNAQVATKVESMTKIAFDITAEKEKRETAINNFVVLARENAGSKLMLSTGIIPQIKRLLKVEKNQDIKISIIRIVSELCKHGPTTCLAALRDLGVPWFIEILDSTVEAQVNAAQYCLQTILNVFSGMKNAYETDTSSHNSSNFNSGDGNSSISTSNANSAGNAAAGRPVKETCEKYAKEIDTVLTCLVFAVNNRVISGLARDSIIELVMRNVHYDALSWAEKLVEIGGIERLMECASELEEYRYESAMNITPSTRTIAAVCLARIHENMYYDAAKESYMRHIDDYIRDKLRSPDTESKVRAVTAMTALLRGALDVGNAIIGRDGIIEMILVMATTDEDPLQQRAACECIVAAASKHDKAKAILAQGMPILKKLYASKDDKIRIRALVGLCKLGSCGGNDASVRPLAEGSTIKLAEACRKFLIHPSKDMDIRKWAAEGLSYLTLDAEVKEKLIEDKPAIKALIEIARTGDQSLLYGCITTLVNLTNSYEKQEIQPEMVELARYAKHHIPVEHEFDDPDFVKTRTVTLAQEGVTSALVALARTESPNSRELIARVFNALCAEVENRGVVVAQGGVKVLCGLALSGTEKGKRQACQALARIAITMNPEVAFPGQRSLEVIRPLLAALHQDCSGLENFEALMGLCNIAQMGETARQRIIKEGGVSKVFHYLYEDHLMLCRAAAQCTTNLCMSPDVVALHEQPDQDRVKMLVALVLDEDAETALAAAGALAILTADSVLCCQRVVESKSWLEAMQCMLSGVDEGMQYRGVCVVRSVVESSKELAFKLMETELMEVLMALTKLEDPKQKKIKTIAEECLKIAEKHGIIQKPTSVDPFALAEQENENEDEE